MRPSRPSIFIAEDDAGIAFVYEELLGARYDLRIFPSLAGFRAAMGEVRARPRLVLADLKLSDGSFLDAIGDASFRAMLTMPFLVVSSVDEPATLTTSFQRGAVDYMVKPLRPTEVIAKVDRYIAGTDLRLDAVADRLHVASAPEPLELTPTETRIIAALLASPERCVARQTLRDELWPATKIGAKTLDTHVSNLRKKLRQAGLDLHLIRDDRYLLGPILKTP